MFALFYFTTVKSVIYICLNKHEKVSYIISSLNGYLSLYNLTINHRFCLFDLILYVPSTIFQLYRDGSSWVEPVLS